MWLDKPGPTVPPLTTKVKVTIVDTLIFVNSSLNETVT